MNGVWILKSMDAYLLMYDKAVAHGKKPGDSMQEEFQEVLKEHPEWFDFKGTTEDDIDVITGNLREQGKKIFNLNEYERQRERDKNA
jgi:hypothetical protein